ncbi:alkene reductase [Puniceicoccaceae bacterium K14]|nr:alkene reductase [Puniceicoccaceae bacterium K14]
MAPLTRCRASEGRVPNELMAEYYRQRASAGLIISEATAVDPTGVGYPNTPGIWSDAQVEGWKKVTQAVHDAGGRILLQLWHVGRISDPEYLDGAPPVAPSALPAPGNVSLLRPERPHPVPRALDIEEIPGIVEAYRRGAENAKRAGFDGVELHGANGYLLDQFLHSLSNHRTDVYGGSIENRARLLLEVVDAAISVWGPDRVGVHLSPRCDILGMGGDDRVETFRYVAEALGAKKIAFIMTRESIGEDSLSPVLKELFGGPYIANEELTADSATGLIADGKAEAVSFGKLYISNPDLVERLEAGVSLADPNPETFYGSGLGPVGYVDYPAMECVK